MVNAWAGYFWLWSEMFARQELPKRASSTQTKRQQPPSSGGGVKGRGGTDFRPGFAWLDEQAIQPGVCLYLTDMECSSYPDAEPGFPVVFCNWGDPPGDWNREPWGERIDIAPEEPQP